MQTAAAFLATVLAAFGGAGATSTPASLQPCVTLERTLSPGSAGSDVVKLQQFLGVKNSGYFGPLTLQKLIAWQIGHSIITSPKSAGAGVAGPKTRMAFRCKTAAASPGTSSTPAKSIILPAQPSSATNTLPIPTTESAPGSSGSGSSGGYMGPAGYFCQDLAPQPSAAICTVGSWQAIQDEAGCYVWDCSDTTETEG